MSQRVANGRIGDNGVPASRLMIAASVGALAIAATSASAQTYTDGTTTLDPTTYTSGTDIYVEGSTDTPPTLNIPSTDSER